jgi:hypothetical protein
LTLAKFGWFATDKEIASLNSWLVIVDRENNVEHHLHSSRAELYLADDIWSKNDQSFCNIHNVVIQEKLHIPGGMVKAFLVP